MRVIADKLFVFIFSTLLSLSAFAQNPAVFEKECTQLNLLGDKGDYKAGLFYSKKLLAFVQKKKGPDQYLIRTYIYQAYFYDKLDHTDEVNACLAQVKRLWKTTEDPKLLRETVQIYALLSEFYFQRGIYTACDSLYTFLNTHRSGMQPFDREILNFYHLTAQYHKGLLNETLGLIDADITVMKGILVKDSVRTGLDDENTYTSLSKNDYIERQNLLTRFIILKGLAYLNNGMADSSELFIRKNYLSYREDVSIREGHLARVHYVLGLDYLDNDDYVKAEREFKSASALAQRYFLPHSSFLIDIKYNLIRALLEQGKTEEAAYYNNDADVKINGYFGTSSLAYLSNSFPDIEHELNYQNWPKAESMLNGMLKSPLLPAIHKDRAKALNYLFTALVQQQKHKEAEAVLEQMLQLQIALTGKNSPAYTILLLKKASFYSYNLDRFSEAKNLFKEVAASDLKNQISVLNPAYYDNMIELAKLYIYTEEFKEAAALLNDELKRTELAASAQSPVYAMYLSHLGELNISTGEYALANKQLEQSMMIFEKNFKKKFSVKYIEALELKIKLNVLEGDYSSANVLLRKAETLAKDLDIPSADDIFLLEETGLLYIKTGKYQQAEKYLNNILKTRERDLGKTHKSLYTTLLYLGELEVVIGNYSEANTYFERAANIAKTTFGDKSIPYATCLLYFKHLYAAIGDYEKAEESIRTALAIYTKSYGDNNIKTGVLMHEMALASFEADLYSGRKAKTKTADIEQLFLKSLKVIKGTSGETSILYAEALESFAVFYAQTGDFTKALSSINTARSIWDAKIGGTNVNSARLYMLAGKIHYRAGSYAEALTDFEKTRDQYKTIFDDNHPGYVEALGRCAQMYYITGNMPKSIVSIEECTNKSLEYIDQIFPFLSERGKMAYWDKIKDDFEFYKTIAFTNSAAYPSMVGKIFNIQLQTKSLLLNSLLKIKNRIYASGDTTAIRLYQEWQNTRDALAIAYSMTAAQRKESDVNVPALEASLEEIEGQLSELSDDFAANAKNNASGQMYTWKNVQKTLADNEMVIETIPFRLFTNTFSDTVWYAFVAVNNKSNAPSFVVIKNGRDLETKYLKYYRNSMKFDIQDDKSYGVYWKPLTPLLDENHPVIYFAGDGVYNQINPETFRDETGTFLIYKKNILCIGSSRDLINRAQTTATKKQKNEPPSTIALIGNPTYYTADVEDQLIVQLPGTETEVIKIDSMMVRKGWVASLYLGDDATEDTVKAIQSPKVYHISTHGFFYKDNTSNQNDELNEDFVSNPLLRSGIVLYNGGTLLQQDNINTVNQADGILTAYEAMNLSLDNTELVVLSACETGLGEVKIGEGVYGLQRAFNVAGAHCIIMSLSKVSDEVTIKLMTDFYSYWLKTGNKREAFIQAKQELIKVYPNPKYWGAFIMIGID